MPVKRYASVVKGFGKYVLTVGLLLSFLTTGQATSLSKGGNSQQSRLVEAHAHYAAAMVRESGGEADAALDEFIQAARLDLDNEELALEVVQRLLARGREAEALKILKQAACNSKASGVVFVQMGLVFEHQGKLDEAITANRQAIKRSPQKLAGYQNLYLNLLEKNHTDKALGVLEEAAKVADVGPDFLITLAELFTHYSHQKPKAREKVRKEALQILDRVNLDQPLTSEQRLKLADGYYTLSEGSRALTLYEGLLADFSDDAPLLASIRGRLVDLYLRRDDRTAALEQLQVMVEADPTNVALLLQLGDIARSLGQYDLAAETFRKVVLLNPRFQPAYYELAQSQLNQDSPQAALATLKMAGEQFERIFVGEYLTAMAYCRLKNYDQGINHLTSAEVIARATETNRLDETFYYQLGTVYERKGDFQEAEKNLLRSLEIAPDFAEAQNYLGYSWADRGEKLDRAYDLLKKAVKTEPENPAFLDSLGWVLFKLNRPADALIQLRKAVDLSPQPDATLLDHLGDIYAALHRWDEARASWKQSLTVEPSAAVRKKLDSTPAY